jgi:hypothetical protein
LELARVSRARSVLLAWARGDTSRGIFTGGFFSTLGSGFVSARGSGF